MFFEQPAESLAGSGFGGGPNKFSTELSTDCVNNWNRARPFPPRLSSAPRAPYSASPAEAGTQGPRWRRCHRTDPVQRALRRHDARVHSPFISPAKAGAQEPRWSSSHRADLNAVELPPARCPSSRPVRFPRESGGPGAAMAPAAPSEPKGRRASAGQVLELAPLELP